MIQNCGHQYNPSSPESASYDDEPLVEVEHQSISSETVIQPTLSGELLKTLLICLV